MWTRWVPPAGAVLPPTLRSLRRTGEGRSGRQNNSPACPHFLCARQLRTSSIVSLSAHRALISVRGCLLETRRHTEAAPALRAQVILPRGTPREGHPACSSGRYNSPICYSLPTAATGAVALPPVAPLDSGRRRQLCCCQVRAAPACLLTAPGCLFSQSPNDPCARAPRLAPALQRSYSWARRKCAAEPWADAVGTLCAAQPPSQQCRCRRWQRRKRRQCGQHQRRQRSFGQLPSQPGRGRGGEHRQR